MTKQLKLKRKISATKLEWQISVSIEWQYCLSVSTCIFLSSVNSKSFYFILLVIIMAKVGYNDDFEFINGSTKCSDWKIKQCYTWLDSLNRNKTLSESLLTDYIQANNSSLGHSTPKQKTPTTTTFNTIMYTRSANCQTNWSYFFHKSPPVWRNQLLNICQNTLLVWVGFWGPFCVTRSLQHPM